MDEGEFWGIACLRSNNTETVEVAFFFVFCSKARFHCIVVFVFGNGGSREVIIR